MSQTPKRKSASAIAEEGTLAKEIARAHSFSAFLLFGPFDRRKVLIECGGAEGYRQARAAADELNRQAASEGSARRAIVYAINNLGSFDVTPEAAALAGLV